MHDGHVRAAHLGGLGVSTANDRARGVARAAGGSRGPLGARVRVVILDTSVWWRYLTAARMSQETRRRIEQARAAGRLQVAAVTLWEFAMLVRDGKLRVDGTAASWLQTALARSGTTVAPLDPGVAEAAARLASDLDDPVGCQILGTAVHLGVPLSTHDRRTSACGRRLGVEVLEP
jgi:PIN domain nuclease of toxin-antitoxin system